MRKLALFLIACALAAPLTSTQAQWAALAKAGAKAAAVERAAAAGAKLAALEAAAVGGKAAAVGGKAAAVEQAGAAGTRAASLERAGAVKRPTPNGGPTARDAALSAEGPAARLEAQLARDAREFGVRRGEDGRFLIDAGRGAARLVRSRVADAVLQSPPMVFARATDGRYLRLGAVGDDLARVREATDAVTDTIGTAMHKAVDNLQGATRARPAGSPAVRAPPIMRQAQLEANARGLLAELENPETLKHAQGLSVSRSAGTRGASLHDVYDVAVVAQARKPSTLLVSLATGKGRPTHLTAQVNLDDILRRIDKTGF